MAIPLAKRGESIYDGNGGFPITNVGIDGDDGFPLPASYSVRPAKAGIQGKQKESGFPLS